MNEETNLPEKVDLKSLEKKVTLIYFQDGFWDMLIGYVLVAFGIGGIFYDQLPDPWNSLLGPILWVLGFITFLISKRLVVFPRLGFVKKRQSQPQKKMLIILVGITAFLVVMTITVVILTSVGALTFSGMGFGVPIIFGLLPATIFSGIALILKYYKLFIHAIVFGIAFFMNEVFHMYNYPVFGDLTQIVCGTIIIAIGVGMLINFLQKYPISDEADIDG